MPCSVEVFCRFRRDPVRGNRRYTSPEIVGRYTAQGRNGLRSGKGFYDWSDKDIGEYWRQGTARLLELLRIANRLPVVADAAATTPDRNEVKR